MVQVAVIGAARNDPELDRLAESVGTLLAEAGAILVCGGMGGVMESACRGARAAGGKTVGILPDTGDGNPCLDIIIRSGLGHARNVLVVQSGDSVIAVGGSHGTLSEIAVALKTGRPVFGLNTWEIEGVIRCTSPEDAVRGAVAAGREKRRSG
ncbi:MAG: TIGR00725 family protein [Methanoregulaceae archaeon]